ncbi:MAG: SpoIID/LytB domain-containing protein [Cyanobacteria bacterium J06638_7]
MPRLHPVALPVAAPRPAGLRRLAPLALVVPVLLAGGCRAQSAPPPPPAAAAEALHWPVPAAPPVEAASPVIWVGLASRLRPSQPIELRSAQGLLTLVAPDGARYQSPSLLLHWRDEPLQPPQRIRRQVLGPFASYESAAEAAARWRQAGAEPVIGFPRDWEVWAAADAPAPAGLGPVRLVEQTHERRAVLELRRDSGPVPLSSALTLEAPGGLRWQGGVFAGPFRLLPDAYGSWSLVETVPLERYLRGVVPHEIGAGSPPVALAAQAVLARTWALGNLQRFAVDGYHLCATVQCQVYADPRTAGAAVRQAIDGTRNQVLAWQGRPIHAVYHATNGGVSAGFEEVWSGEPLPYLRPRVDGAAAQEQRFSLPLAPSQLGSLLAGTGFYGADHPRFRWTRTLEAGQLRQALLSRAPQLGAPAQVRVLERGPSGRVLALEVTDSGGQKVVLRLDAIRRTLTQLPSTLFLVEPAGAGRWRVVGGGFGHGAGLSQAGAIDLARRGWGLQRILAHYYPGTQLLPLSSLGAGATGEAP